ncbi:hypothetical protein V6N13_032872 [Hibiscus sabdariffa]
MHVVFDDNLLPRKDSCDDDDVGILQSIGGEPSSKEDEVPTKEEETQDPPLEALKDMNLEEREVAYPRELNYVKGGEILGDPSKGVTTRASLKNTCHYVAFISCIEPKNIKEALNDDFWILAMQEELNQFDRSNVWTLVDRPHDKSTIGTKWVFRNKLDESGNIVRNKARLVAQGYTQEEGIDFDETYAPVARMEAIRMLLAFACHHEFKLFQMDVKSAFLNGFINEEVYVEQPPGFEDPKFPNHVFKLSKALYGLKQAPRAWYERLSNFLVEKGFNKGNVDTTLFIKNDGKDILVVQIYVDDIIFGSTNELLCQDFAKLMQGEFEMSMMGELSFFLGLQIKQSKDGIFINQAKYIKEKLKKFGMENMKPQATPMSSSIKLDKDEEGKCVDSKLYRSMIGSLLYLTASRPDIMFSVCLCARFQANPKESHLKAVKRIFRYLLDTPSLGLWYPRDSTFDLHAYSDADYGGFKIDRKSTSGTCQFLGNMLISWFSKKQNSVALSTTEAEYISAGSCCAQVLWMKQQLFDYGIDVGTDTANTVSIPDTGTDTLGTRIGTQGLFEWHPKPNDPVPVLLRVHKPNQTFPPIVLDTQTIATHLGLQNTGLAEESTTFLNLYPPGTSTSVLDAHDRFLHLMVSWFFRPSGGKFSTIRGIDAFWIHFFRNNIRINLAQIIFSDMVYTVNHRHTNLVKSFPYGTVLSHIFLKEQIDCSVDLALPLTELIDEKSLRKCKFHLVNNEWVRNPNPQDDDGDDVQPPLVPPVVAAPPPVDIQALFAQLNANLDAHFTAIDARFTTFTDDVNARFNSLDARHNAMETRFKAQEDALRRVETEVSAHHLEWSSHTFGGLGLNDHSDEDDDIPPS